MPSLHRWGRSVANGAPCSLAKGLRRCFDSCPSEQDESSLRARQGSEAGDDIVALKRAANPRWRHNKNPASPLTNEHLEHVEEKKKKKGGGEMVQAMRNPFLASATQNVKKKKSQCQAGTEPSQAPAHKVHLDVVAAGCLAAGCKCHRGSGRRGKLSATAVPKAVAAAAAAELFFLLPHGGGQSH